MDAIEREVTLPVEADEAWGLLTRPDDLPGWLGAEVELDLVPGRTGRVIDHDGTERRLVIDTVEAGRRITWRWWDEQEPDEVSHIEISLAPTADGTTVRVVEELVGATPVAHARAQARAGEAWSHRLLHLEALLLVAAAVRG
jgi:uncharacterized protein YndB with AHSA1/START domain